MFEKNIEETKLEMMPSKARVGILAVLRCIQKQVRGFGHVCMTTTRRYIMENTHTENKWKQREITHEMDGENNRNLKYYMKQTETHCREVCLTWLGKVPKKAV